LYPALEFYSIIRCACPADAVVAPAFAGRQALYITQRSKAELLIIYAR
jgi:hypothetical protein